MTNKKKKDELDITEIKRLCCKGHHRQGEKPEQEKAFANHLSDNRMVPKMYKELSKYSNKKMNGQTKNVSRT